MPRTKKETTVQNKAVKKDEKKQNSAEGKTAVKTKALATGEKVSFSVPVFELSGKQSGSLDLPKEVFGAKVNKSLLSQALRVYLSNQKAHWGNTKTRGEVQGSTRKIYKQKGTGRARHGSVMAPIFVHGGIALGPKARNVVLELPKKMKKAALTSALSQKLSENQVFGLAGLEKASGKTKEAAVFAKNLGNKSVLIVTDQKRENAQRAFRNIPGFDVQSADQINILEIISHKSLVLTKEAVDKLLQRVDSESRKAEK